MSLTRDNATATEGDARGDNSRSTVAALIVAFLFIAAVSVFVTTAHGHAHPTSGAPVVSTTVGASLSEWSIGLDRTTLPAGTYTFKIADNGKQEHELIAFRTDGTTALPMKTDAAVDEDSAAIVKATDGDDLTPGTTQTRTIDLSKPGTYVFLCNLPGHYKLGMHQIVTVTPAG